MNDFTTKDFMEPVNIAMVIAITIYVIEQLIILTHFKFIRHFFKELVPKIQNTFGLMAIEAITTTDLVIMVIVKVIVQGIESQVDFIVIKVIITLIIIKTTIVNKVITNSLVGSIKIIVNTLQQVILILFTEANSIILIIKNFTNCFEVNLLIKLEVCSISCVANNK